MNTTLRNPIASITLALSFTTLQFILPAPLARTTTGSTHPRTERDAVGDELDTAIANTLATLASIAQARAELEWQLALLATRAHAAKRVEQLRAVAQALAPTDPSLRTPVLLLADDVVEAHARDDEWGWAMLGLAATAAYERRFDVAEAYLDLGRGHAYSDVALVLT